MKWWIWIVLAAVVLLLPIVVNFVVLSRVIGVPVAGQPENWIGFWGSYAGGCITALISFAILYRTIAYYRAENSQRLAEAHKERLRTELSTRLALLDTKRFTVYYERLREGQDVAVLCKNIEDVRIQIVNDLNSFRILYTGVHDLFIMRYEVLVNRLDDCLSWLSDTLSQIPNDGTPARITMIERSKARFDRLAEVQTSVEEVWKMASEMVNGKRLVKL